MVTNNTGNRRLNGLNPLSYLGDNPTTPPNFFSLNRDPGVNDWQDVQLCDLWLNTLTEDVWVLVSLNNNQATWVLLTGGSGSVTELTADLGGSALPLNGNINIFTAPSPGNNVDNLVSDAVTPHTITLRMNNSIVLPKTTSLTNGVIFFDGAGIIPYIHNSGTVSATPNIFVGANSGNLATTSVANSAVGEDSLKLITSGSTNMAFGANSLSQLLTGNFNVCVGQSSGGSYTGAESSNICIGSPGTIGDNNTIRIGAPGGGAGNQNLCFIAGIAGVTTTVNDAIPVLVSATTDQLGTVSSSIRYKQNIKDMENESSIIMKLRPVIFNYKQHPVAPAWGLIAEEVDKVFPQLVVYKDNEPETVKYHELVPLLLNEVQKLYKRVNELENKLK